MKKILILSFLIPSSIMTAEASDISIGLGAPYSGILGVKYSYEIENIKLYGSLGVLDYSSDSGTVTGYGGGIDYNIQNSNSAIGIYLGTVSAIFIGKNSEVPSSEESSIIFKGISLNYQYFISGFKEKSLILGVNAYTGEASDKDPLTLDSKDTGAGFIIGYQF